MSDLSRDDIEAAIDKWIIGRNAERNRQILKRRIFDGITYDRLAEEFELSVRQVKNIVYHSEEKIYKHI